MPFWLRTMPRPLRMVHSPKTLSFISAISPRASRVAPVSRKRQYRAVIAFTKSDPSVKLPRAGDVGSSALACMPYRLTAPRTCHDTRTCPGPEPAYRARPACSAGAGRA
ncbi:hypothetical protein CBM2623_A280038 [Cupriavidus taiwanensis]|nr:hypothetical protein CBM2608_A290037 [Cupriavidus taiwanensis]SPA28412.1 hypothetical protein CBM2623_A280038 [Cupriavidus taiwanensis]